MAVQESDMQDVKSLGSGEGKKIMLTISSEKMPFPFWNDKTYQFPN